MQETIKPCPLCAGSAVIYALDDHLAANGTWMVSCDHCNLVLETYYILDGYPGADKLPAYKEAVKKWNRRLR